MSLDLRRWSLAICGEPAIEEKSSYFKIITTTHCKANATYFAPWSPAGFGAPRCSRDCRRWSRLGVDLASIISLKIDSSFVSKHCVNGEIVLSWKPKRALRTPLSSPQRSCKCMQYKGNAESLLVSLPHCACQQHVPSVRTLGFQK